MNTRAMLAGAFGLVMVLATVGGFPVSACAAVLVIAGLLLRVFTILAVLCVIGILAFTDSSPVSALLSGLAAVLYLLTAYPLRWPPQVNALRYEVIVPALVFGCVALLAAAIPMGRSSWLPLTVPVAVIVIYVLTLRPFTQGNGGAVER
ncbi:hypothetical protein [Mycobacteroides abscessus]|uniref:hypothetical protein n=1 Tax=Mycobacteroides abscessus TaxID=36809 RepID=UPI00163995BE|nr:hypothetical protein [Mycobacteroides abscessus]